MSRKPSPKITPYHHKDGTTTYRVRVRLPSKQTTETFDSYIAAQSFVTMVVEDGAVAAVANRDMLDINSKVYVPTLAEMLDRHINALTGVEQRTRDDYRAAARRSWLPMLGKTRVSMMTREHVARWVNDQDGKSAPKTIANAHSLLSSVLESAVRDGHLTTNPARGTRLPRSGEHENEGNRYLTYSEFDRFIQAVEFLHPHYLPFVILLFGTGLRFSEATALQVQDINPENKTLRVMRAWKGSKHPRRIGPPKSKASRRTIWIDDITLDAIKPLLVDEDGGDRPGTDWLFTTATGKVINHGNIHSRVWLTCCAAAWLIDADRPRIHDARHSHASWLIAQGVRLEVVQDRLGHDDYQVTRRVYGHLLPDLRREAGMAAQVAFAQTTLGAGRKTKKKAKALT